MATIQELFDKYNRQYFGGKVDYTIDDTSLRDAFCLFFGCLDGLCCSGKKVIFINAIPPDCCEFCRDEFYREVGVLPKEEAVGV